MDGQTLFVDGDVVMEPAEGDQIVVVGGTALGPWDGVVYLEPISG